MSNEQTRFSEMELDLTPAEIEAWYAKRTKAAPAVEAPAPIVVEEAPASPCLPLKNPEVVPAVCQPLVGERKTAHGATMSPRMHRFARWNQENGTGISDWSTDTMVQVVLPKLTQLLEREKAALFSLPMGSEYATIQAELVRDIEGLMQRVPANRVPTVAEAAAEEKKAFKDGLIAVATSSDVTGGVIYWQLTGEVNRDELVAAMVEQGLSEEDAPALPTPEVALGRAAKELQSRSVLIRKLKVGGWAVVSESEVQGALQHQQIVRVFLQGEKDQETIKYAATPGFEAEAALEADRIIAEYNKARAALSVIDLSSWLVRLASKTLEGVPLRDRGGIYFVPRANIEAVRKVKAALAAKSGCIIHEIPAMHSSEAIAAIYDAVGSESSAFISEVESELEAGIGPRAAKNRVKEVEVFLKKVRNYESLLGQKFTAPADKLAKLVERLNKATTRASQLEID